MQTVFLYVLAVATTIDQGKITLQAKTHSIVKTVSLYQMASFFLSSLSLVFLYKLTVFAC
jgi:DNA-binding protein